MSKARIRSFHRGDGPHGPSTAHTAISSNRAVWMLGNKNDEYISPDGVVNRSNAKKV